MYKFIASLVIVVALTFFSPTSPAAGIQYISDEKGDITGVIVPIDLWREIESERETAYLLSNKTMKKRLLEARARFEGDL